MHKVDQSHIFSNFCKEYAAANNADMAQKQATADRKKKNADEQPKKLWEFKPILNLMGKMIKNACVEHMKTQLQWHCVIGSDNEIPPGFSQFKKEKLWDTLSQAVKWYQEKNMGCKGKQTIFSSL